MERFRITRLEVNEIGPFGHLVLDFPDKPAGMEDKAEVHILTGENGTGKTTVLEMLVPNIDKHLFSNLDRFLSSFDKILLPKSDILAKCRYLDNRSSFSHYFQRKDFTRYIRSNSGNKFDVQSGNKKIWTSYNNAYENLYNRPFEIAFFAYSGYRRTKEKEIIAVQELSNHPFENAADFKNSVQPEFLLQWIANTIAKASLEQTQGNPELAKQYQASIQRLESAIEKIVGRSIRFQLKTQPFRVEIIYDDAPLSFDLLPDGLKSIISWLGDLLMRMDRVKWINDIPVFERNFILFLDEIEVHMHPAWQRKILPAVQSLFPNAQIFISTHSPFVVNSVDGAWIHRFVKSNGDSKLDGKPILSEDGKSISLVLEEIFNVPERFGVGAQQQLKEFYHHRDEILKGANGQTAESMLRLAKDIALQSDELRLIMEMELRQINRRKQLTLTLD